MCGNEPKSRTLKRFLYQTNFECEFVNCQKRARHQERTDKDELVLQKKKKKTKRSKNASQQIIVRIGHLFGSFFFRCYI